MTLIPAGPSGTGGALVATFDEPQAGRRIVLAGKCSELAERDYFNEHVRPRLGSDVEWRGEVSGAGKYDLLAAASALEFPLAWDDSQFSAAPSVFGAPEAVAPIRGRFQR